MSQSVESLDAATPAFRVTGHFGELLRGRLGPNGPLALISLPCPKLWVECMPDTCGDDALISQDRFKALCQALDVNYPCPRP